MDAAIQLVKRPATYKMIIPQEVEKKIRFYCQEVSEVEWSGVLFFTYRGSFETNDLTIICKDIFLMDIGSATYTEFKMSPDVMTYMCEHPELMDYQTGLCHSHNKMSTFFSGTDTATLKEEGNDRNCFVSLIVNNAGQYTAAITRKVISTKTIKDCYKYEFFGEGATENCKDYIEKSTIIEYFMLGIEKEDAFNPLQDMKDRLKEIREAKAKENIKTPILDSPITYNHFSSPFYEQGRPVHAFDSLKNFTPPFEVNDVYGNDYDIDGEKLSNTALRDYDIEYDGLTADDETIDTLVLRILTGNRVILPNPKFDVTKWVNSMEKTYDNAFSNMKEFRDWADIYIEHLTWNVDDPELIKFGCNSEEIQGIVAFEVQQQLKELPSNKYIKIFIEELDKYII